MTEREIKNLWACIDSLLDAKIIDSEQHKALAQSLGLL